jgi:hypothetical protein
LSEQKSGFNGKWFLIGIGVGFVLSMIIGLVWMAVEPYETIEQVCYDQTFTPEEYNECLLNFGVDPDG